MADSVNDRLQRRLAMGLGDGGGVDGGRGVGGFGGVAGGGGGGGGGGGALVGGEVWQATYWYSTGTVKDSSPINFNYDCETGALDGVGADNIGRFRLVGAFDFLYLHFNFCFNFFFRLLTKIYCIQRPQPHPNSQPQPHPLTHPLFSQRPLPLPLHTPPPSP